MLSHFGEGASNPGEYSCDVCTRRAVREDIQTDKTELAKTVIHCVIEMQPLRKVTVTWLSQVLMGSASAEIVINGLDKLTSYGKGNELLVARNGRKRLEKFIYYLILKGLLKERMDRVSHSNIFLTVGNVSGVISGAI